MSVLSASSLSTSGVSFARRAFIPLPKRRRTSLPGSEVGGPISNTDTSFTPSTHYHPANDGKVDKLKQEFNTTSSQLHPTDKPSSFSARPRVIDDADGEGDYTDHLQQPNNTKKRKVPAATVVAAARETIVVQGNDDLIDENPSQDSQVNLSEKGTEGTGACLGQELDFQPTITSRRRTYSPITLATLRLKELLTARRKMMAAAIRDDVDPLAVDFALSAPFTGPPAKQLLRAWSYGPKFRRRPRNRVISASHRESCFSGHFTFSVPSPISKRYITAQKAAAGLKLRFQTELARQATTAAEIALKTTSKLSHNSSTGERKVDSGSSHIPSNSANTDKAPKKSSKTKKKKRSALANASNPHHLRNYVPSRVSQLGGHSAPSTYGQSQSNSTLGPLALKFLSATLPPRRKGRASGAENLGLSLIRPETEWICPFCEYSLFYSDDAAAMHRAVKNRRRILARRRNARERAAVAASGAIAPRSQDASDDESESDEEEDSFDEGSDIVPVAPLPREAGTTGARQDNRGPHPGG